MLEQNEDVIADEEVLSSDEQNILAYIDLVNTIQVAIDNEEITGNEKEFTANQILTIAKTSFLAGEASQKIINEGE